MKYDKLSPAKLAELTALGDAKAGLEWVQQVIAHPLFPAKPEFFATECIYIAALSGQVAVLAAISACGSPFIKKVEETDCLAIESHRAVSMLTQLPAVAHEDYHVAQKRLVEYANVRSSVVLN